MSSYSRSFIPLKQDSPGFSANGKPPVGKCIIEKTNDGKVRVSVSVTNLKPETVYRLYLISGTDGSSFCAGKIAVDLSGRGDEKWALDQNRGGLYPTRVDAVSVITGTGEFIPVLTGYRDFEISWKNNFKPSDMIGNKEPLIQSAPENNESDSIEWDGAKAPDEKEVYKPVEEMAYKFTDGLNSTENAKILSDEEFFELVNGVKPPETDTDIIEEMFAVNLRIYPCIQRSKFIEWVKIGLRDAAHLPLPQSAACIAEDNLIIRSYHEFKHLIFGRARTGNGTEYYLGVPSAYDGTEAGMFALLGFANFEVCDEDVSLGYYIMKFS